jgi:hypothetical protein
MEDEASSPQFERESALWGMIVEDVTNMLNCDTTDKNRPKTKTGYEFSLYEMDHIKKMNDALCDEGGVLSKYQSKKGRYDAFIKTIEGKTEELETLKKKYKSDMEYREKTSDAFFELRHTETNLINDIEILKKELKRIQMEKERLMNLDQNKNDALSLNQPSLFKCTKDITIPTFVFHGNNKIINIDDEHYRGTLILNDEQKRVLYRHLICK